MFADRARRLKVVVPDSAREPVRCASTAPGCAVAHSGTAPRHAAAPAGDWRAAVGWLITLWPPRRPPWITALGDQRALAWLRARCAPAPLPHGQRDWPESASSVSRPRWIQAVIATARLAARATRISPSLCSSHTVPKRGSPARILTISALSRVLSVGGQTSLAEANSEIAMVVRQPWSALAAD